MNTNRLDRTAFRITTFEEAEHTRAYWLSKTPAERLAAAWVMICRAYGLDPNVEHRFGSNVFFNAEKGCVI